MPPNSHPQLTQILETIQQAVESLRYGSIEITVHEGRITQIEKREKQRFIAATGDKAI